MKLESTGNIKASCFVYLRVFKTTFKLCKFRFVILYRQEPEPTRPCSGSGSGQKGGSGSATLVNSVIPSSKKGKKRNLTSLVHVRGVRINAAHIVLNQNCLVKAKDEPSPPN